MLHNIFILNLKRFLVCYCYSILLLISVSCFWDMLILLEHYVYVYFIPDIFFGNVARAFEQLFLLKSFCLKFSANYSRIRLVLLFCENNLIARRSIFCWNIQQNMVQEHFHTDYFKKLLFHCTHKTGWIYINIIINVNKSIFYKSYIREVLKLFLMLWLLWLNQVFKIIEVL